MISIEEKKEWILNNCIDRYGDINLNDLDFSDFDGNVDISNMRVKGDLYQGYQKVEGNLNQANQEVKGDLYQCSQKVEGDLRQGYQEVKGMLSQSLQKVEGNLHQYCQEVKGILHQGCQKVEEKMFLQDTSELQKAFDNDGAIYYEKVEKIPEMTLEEIKPKLGYKFKLKETVLLPVDAESKDMVDIE